MAHVVIIGASTGGMLAAYEMRAALDIQHQVTVISNAPSFHFVPSNPWIAVGWRKRNNISFDIEPRLKNKGIDFSAAGVKEIRAEENQLLLGDGSLLAYDYLIVATGPKLAFDEIQGLGPEGYTESICTVDHAEEAYQSWKAFLKKPGPIVVGAVQGASCFGPSYEYALMMNKVLRKAKIRDRVPMTFVTPEPYIGHLGLGGMGDSKALFESEFRKNDIKWITNAKVKKIEEGKMVVEQVNDQAQTIKTYQLPFNFSMMLPAFKGVGCVASLGAEAVNPRGFLLIDDYQRNRKYPNIFGVGVCIAINAVEATPLPVGVPKTGYMIESMAKAATENIKAEIEGKEPTAIATWNAICLADMGDTGAVFTAIPQIPPRNLVWLNKGRWVNYAKKAYEKYFIYKMKKGYVEPIFENKLLRLFGINKLK
jgi:sulfide:quinone oxidoreductase